MRGDPDARLLRRATRTGARFFLAPFVLAAGIFVFLFGLGLLTMTVGLLAAFFDHLAH